MALIKNIPTEFGIDATYHHICRLDSYPREGIFDVLINGYASEQARRDGKQCIFSFQRRYEAPEGADITQESAYGLIKLEPEFTNSTDS